MAARGWSGGGGAPVEGGDAVHEVPGGDGQHGVQTRPPAAAAAPPAAAARLTPRQSQRRGTAADPRGHLRQPLSNSGVPARLLRPAECHTLPISRLRKDLPLRFSRRQHSAEPYLKEKLRVTESMRSDRPQQAGH